jgi:RNA-directed DNA polymerase
LTSFLGQHIRRHGNKVLLKPSRKNVQAFLAKVDTILQRDGGHLTAGDLIVRLNPLLRGWALYHRHAASTRTFARVDRLIMDKLWRWARRRHRQQAAAWVRAKYFTRADGRRAFRGLVTDEKGRVHPVLLLRTSAVGIRRHVKIRSEANPYDPSWELYFEERLAAQMSSNLAGRGTVRYLWLEQEGNCLLCGQSLALEEEWHVHHLLWRSHGGDDTVDNLVLLHANCHRQVHSQGLVVNKTASREGRS